DAITLTRHAGDLGCAGVLLLPPFYYKKITDDGLFAFVGRLIERAGPNVPRILLYHIPPIAVVGWSINLVGRLIEAFPGIVAGMKDSAGDFDHVTEMISTFPGFAVFPGAEVHLLRGMQAGAVGCISASANINARGIADLMRHWREPGAERRQEEANTIRKAVESRGLIPAIKTVLAARYRDDAWRNVRPPLMPLTDDVRGELLADSAIAALLEATPA
ncbi:MAG: dihydrodipicolinate synthase family protein, partial [Bauldia sp.]|nr:dihydrodipicolinate synthase family protein [Bauldia sp.]